MNKRRSLTPTTETSHAEGGEHAKRRSGARIAVSDRIRFRALGEGGVIREGWALNVSRGGVRAILDEDTGKVELGEQYEIWVGSAETDPKAGRIVWLQEEPDGFVVGVEYLSHSDASGVTPAVTPDATVDRPIGATKSKTTDEPRKA